MAESVTMGKAHAESHTSGKQILHAQVAPELDEIKSRLQDLERALTAIQMGACERPTLEDVEPLETMLNRIAVTQEDNAFKVNGQIPAGQAVLSGLLSRCYLLLHLIKTASIATEQDRARERRATHNHLQQILLRSQHGSTGAFGTVDSQLSDVKGRLERIQQRFAHYLSQTPGSYKLEDLAALQEELAAIDATREDNAFKVNGQIPPGQAVLSALLNRCYVMLSLVRDHAEF
eukprot:TRINITY_DN949_c0_g1_i3.p1 TRINITY_DN949_c0_g1~~TRINITY_DN949_c0_g1_i3.p1  ORF type:complete len:267 (+),score=62.03 TRINITY_DN949_c0_g1_i3:104-802(+)